MITRVPEADTMIVVRAETFLGYLQADGSALRSGGSLPLGDLEYSTRLRASESSFAALLPFANILPSLAASE